MMWFLLTLLLNSAAIQTVTAQKCSPLEIVIARGSGEAAGYGTVCGPFFKATQKLIPGVTGYAVKCPAGLGTSSPEKGVEDVLRYFSTQPKACPQQKYVLSGYSQGAVVMHRAAVKMDKAILDRIIATVTYGDGGQQATKQKPIYKSPVGDIPVWPAELDGKIKFNCAPNDTTCDPKSPDAITGLIAHTSYPNNVAKYMASSATFVKEAFEKSGSAGLGAGTTQAVVFSA